MQAFIAPIPPEILPVTEAFAVRVYERWRYTAALHLLRFLAFFGRFIQPPNFCNREAFGHEGVYLDQRAI